MSIGTPREEPPSLEPTGRPPEHVGVARRTAYGLGVIGLPMVHRSTIRALLPRGAVTVLSRDRAALKVYRNPTANARRNRTSVQFQDALRRFEDWAWVSRGSEFIRVGEAESLLTYATLDLPAGLDHAYFVDIRQALGLVRGDIEKPPPSVVRGWVQQRERELKALEELMRGPLGGSNWSGRGSVRFIR